MPRTPVAPPWKAGLMARGSPVVPCNVLCEIHYLISGKMRRIVPQPLFLHGGINIIISIINMDVSKMVA